MAFLGRRALGLASLPHADLGGFNGAQIQFLSAGSAALVAGGVSLLFWVHGQTSASIKDVKDSIKDVKDSIKDSEARTSASIKDVKDSIKDSEARTSASIKDSEARTSASINKLEETIVALTEVIESSSKRSAWWSG